MKVTRIIGDKVLVRPDKLPDRVGSLAVPEGSYVEKDCMATVLKVGTGVDTRKGRIPLDLKEGDRVCIIRLHEKTSTQEWIGSRLGNGEMILPTSAILYVVDRDDSGDK